MLVSMVTSECLCDDECMSVLPIIADIIASLSSCTFSPSSQTIIFSHGLNSASVEKQLKGIYVGRITYIHAGIAKWKVTNLVHSEDILVEVIRGSGGAVAAAGLGLLAFTQIETVLQFQIAKIINRKDFCNLPMCNALMLNHKSSFTLFCCLPCPILLCSDQTTPIVIPITTHHCKFVISNPLSHVPNTATTVTTPFSHTVSPPPTPIYIGTALNNYKISWSNLIPTTYSKIYLPPTSHTHPFSLTYVSCI